MSLDWTLNLPRPQGRALEDWATRFAHDVEDRLRRIGVQVQRLQKNSTGTVFGPKTLFNLIEGSNVTLTVAEDNINDKIDITIASTGGGGSTHNLLDAGTHLDSVTQGASRGSLVYGNATPKWDELIIGAAGTFIRSNGTDISWQALVDADIPNTITIDNLTQVTTRNHSDLQGIGANDHHSQSHVLATNLALGVDHTMSGATAGHVLRASAATAAAFAQLAHADLGSVTADQHHAQSHVLATSSALGADHTVSGLTTGHVLTALSATTAAFQALPAADTHALLSATHSDTVVNAPSRGSLIYGNATPAWDELIIGGAARFVRSNGTDISWEQVTLTSDVTGVLPIANGGTNGATALAAFDNLSPLTTIGDLLTRDTTNNIRLPIGGAGRFLRSDGTNPSWQLLVDTDIPDTITLSNITQITTRSHASLQDLVSPADDHTQYFLLAGRSGGQSAKGGTATGDNLDIDPSSASNYTGSVRISPNAGDYGSGSVTGVVLWPNGFTHGGGVGQVLSGIALTNTISFDANEALTPINLFRADPTLTNTTSSVSLFGTFIGFSAQPTLTNAQNVAAATGFLYGLQYAPTLSTTGGNTLAVTNLNAIRSIPALIPASVTVTNLRHFFAENTTVSGTLGTNVAFDTTVATGSTCLALRSTSAAAQVWIAGAAKYGTSAAPDTTNGNVFELERVHTLGASIGDGQAAGVVLDPGYTAAFTVTRHNYAKYEDVSVAASAVVTDSCVAWFDAAIGTHKAVDNGTTKTSPGTVTAWVKVNLNGVVHYIPVYASKTT